VHEVSPVRTLASMWAAGEFGLALFHAGFTLSTLYICSPFTFLLHITWFLQEFTC
jgi:hypothetical protein